MENMFTQMNAGAKHIAERFAEVAPPVHHEQHVYYGYEPSSSHEHASSKLNYASGHKNNAAMSALTLLAFLFFLHILQQCVKEHMNSMTNPQVVIMTAGRDGEEMLPKIDYNDKLDKTGVTDDKVDVQSAGKENKMAANRDSSTESQLMKITTALHTPKNSMADYSEKHYGAKQKYHGFVNAMTEDYQNF